VSLAIDLSRDRRAHRRHGPALAIIAVALSATPALADRPWHGSIGAGSSLSLTGHDGTRLRYELEVDLEPASRYGGLIAWRGFDDQFRGMLLGGLMFEGAAARPRLVVGLHVDAGADLDQEAPVLGGGIRTTLTIYKQLGIAFDSGAYLVLDGLDDTRLRLMGSTSIVARW
jgi:hypothetical protein